MNVALNEANEIQRRIDDLDERIAEVPEVKPDKYLTDIVQTLKLAIRCVEEDHREAVNNLFTDTKEKSTVRQEIINKLTKERKVLCKARDALLTPSSTITWTGPIS